MISNIDIIWEYQVNPDHIDAYIEAYTNNGTWAQFFRQFPGYIGTDLLRDAKNPTKFITIDHWQSAADFDHMKNVGSEAYSALDAKFEKYTLEEKFIGTYVLP